MPFKSKAQRRKFAQLLVDGKITDETYEEWNRSTGGRELPERLGRKAGDAGAATKKRTAKKRTAKKKAATKAGTPRKSKSVRKRPARKRAAAMHTAPKRPTRRG
jgi:hypothetical protein